MVYLNLVIHDDEQCSVGKLCSAKLDKIGPVEPGGGDIPPYAILMPNLVHCLPYLLAMPGILTILQLGAIFILRKDIEVGGPENGNFR